MTSASFTARVRLILPILLAAWMGTAAIGLAQNAPAAQSQQKPAVEGKANDPVMDDFRKAVDACMKENYTVGIPLLESVIERDPTLDNAWEVLGRAYWSTGKPKAARELWERFVSINPSAPRIHKLLGQLAVDENRLADAIRHFRESLQQDPRQYNTWLDMAKVQRWSGHFGDSIAILRRLHQEDPTRTDVTLQLARALLDNWDYEEALPLWRELRDLDADNEEYIIAEAAALVNTGQLDQGLDSLSTVLATSTNNLRALLVLANAAEYGKQPQDAVPYLNRLLSLASDNAKTQIRQRLIDLHVRLNRADPLKYSIDPAIALTKEQLKETPESVDMILLLGELYLINRTFGDAEQLFLRVIRDYNPNNLRARRGLVETYLGKRDYRRAEENLKLVEAFNPRDPYLHYTRARFHASRGQYTAASREIDALEEAGKRGAVAVLLYHGLSTSDLLPVVSVRRFREQIEALLAAGFRTITPYDLPEYFDMPESIPRRTIRLEEDDQEQVEYEEPGDEELEDQEIESEESADERPVGTVLDDEELDRLERELLKDAEDKPSTKSEGQQPEEQKPERPKKPVKRSGPDRLVIITFDDARRDSLKLGTPIAEELRLGTPVAEDLNLTFTMFVPVGNVERGDPFIATWEQMRAYQESGQWVFCSHLYHASDLGAVDESGTMVRTLVNRLWLPDQGRLETPREYLHRLRDEYELSRKVLTERLGFQSPYIVAYPMGDIGQESGANMKNVLEANLRMAEANYTIGFIQSQFGYAVNGDNPLLYQRHELERSTSGEEAVNYILSRHPVFLARRLRTEFAALQGKVYEALEGLKQLKRDGYPEQSYRELSEYVRSRLARKAEAPEAVDKVHKGPFHVQLRDPFVGANAEWFRDNLERQHWRLTGTAGLSVTPNITVEGRSGLGWFRQDPTSGSTTLTSRVEVDERSVGLAGSVTVPTARLLISDLLLSSEVMWRNYSCPENENEVRWAVEGQFKPLLFLDVLAHYEHDRLPSAYAITNGVNYNFALLQGVVSVRDWWDVWCSFQHYSFSDDNTRWHATVDSTWLLYEPLGLHVGLRYAYATADKKHEYYWTPYELSRFYLEGILRGTFRRTYYNIYVRPGIGREETRPEDQAAHEAALERARRQHFTPEDELDDGWHFVFSIGASTRMKLGKHWEFNGEAVYNQNPNYNEVSVLAGFRYRF